MKIIADVSIKDRDEALKYAYSFMQAERLNMRECSFLNPTPSKFDSTYIAPRDMFLVYQESTVPEWEEFRKNPAHLKAPGFSCVACLDTKDKKRVTLLLMGNKINFICYGNYVKEAERAYQEILKTYSAL